MRIKTLDKTMIGWEHVWSLHISNCNKCWDTFLCKIASQVQYSTQKHK